MNDHELTLFKEYVAEWIEKDKEIKEYQTKIKQLQDNKTNNLMPKIVEFMKNNGIQELKTETAGKITLNTVKKRSTITKKNIKEKLLLELDEQVALKIFNELYSSRTITETTGLMRK
jgi:UDP-galactopyranose mutase